MKNIITISALCLLFTLRLHATDEEQKKTEQEEAADVFLALDETGNYGSLNTVDVNELPMGVKRTIGNVEYTIAVSEYVQNKTTGYGELTIYGLIKPSEKQQLFFGAQGIKISHDGDIIGDVKLLLLGDISIPINGGKAELILRGDFDTLKGRGIEKTYMTIDCKGFKELFVTADVLFSETTMRRVDENGKAAGRVAASFESRVSDWDDIVVSLDMPRFEIVGLDGFVFDVKQAIFDFSDKRNEPKTQFPSNYESKYLVPGHNELWKGVFVENFEVVMPKRFTTRDTTRRISFAAKNLLIDNNGISGTLSGKNVLSLDKGSAGGWRFSVNEFSMTLEANRLTGAGFAGQIGLPVSETANLAYRALITPGNEYLLKVSPAKSVKFDVWAAKAEISDNSYVELKVVNGRFKPEAVLNGSLNVAIAKTSDTAKHKAELKGIKFAEMRLSSEAPYFSVKNMGYDGEMKLGAFPLSVGKIEVKTANKEATLGFDANISLAGDKSPIQTGTRFEVVGEISENGWKYKRLDVADIKLNVSMSGTFDLTGTLKMMNDDPVYGDGFDGSITLKISKGLDLTAKVRAVFGNVGYRYWLVDGSAKFSPGITVYPSMKINGFGGGASYCMRPEGKSSSMPTGTKYVPDNNFGLGLKASVMFNIGKEGLIDGEAMLEIAFNRNGGLNFMGFYGQAKFMGTIPGTENVEKFVNGKFAAIAKKEAAFTKNNPELVKKLDKLKVEKSNDAAAEVYEPSEKAGEAGMLAMAGMKFDFQNNSFHANFDLYANIAGGMLRGVGAQNKAGSVVLHIASDKWYMHVGTPTNRIGLELNLLKIVSIKTKSYFMVGHDIPGSPPPPKQVADILGVDINKLDYMRDLNALGNGRGIAFGSDFGVSTGDLTFLILYANFQAGLGFDIMLKDYGAAYCRGRSGKIGVDGWYANGQAYAYLQGELGINVKLWFVKKKIPIIKGAAAALIQAKLPNPSWFAGNLGVRFDLLGGLVRGNMQFKFTLGEECDIVIPDTRPLDVGEIISEITPAENSTDVDVFASPQVAFNMPIDKSFNMEDAAGNNRSYRLKLEEFSVSDGATVIDGVLKRNANKDNVSFEPHETLPSEKQLKTVVRVSFEENKGGKWETVKENGVKAEEKIECKFGTGKAPTSIPENNIRYSYPVSGQKYYYVKESKKSYVQLLRGQPELFGSDMKHELHITGVKNKFKIPIRYDAPQKRIEYTMPDIGAESEYKLEILSFPATTEKAATSEDRRVSVLSDAENDVTLRNAAAADVTRSDAGISRLSYDFAASGYGTFKEKIDDLRTKIDSLAWFEKDGGDENVYLYFKIKRGATGEASDIAELSGVPSSENKPLVSVRATLTDAYYRNKMYPLVYNGYPKKGIVFTHRNTSVLGVPPAKAITVTTEYLTEIENGIFDKTAKSYLPYRYDLQREYRRDYLNLRMQVADRRDKAGFENLLVSTFSRLSYGYYEIELRYLLPDGTIGSAAYLKFFNPLF